MKQIPQQKHQQNSEEILKDGIEWVKTNNCKITTYFEHQITIFENHNRKYKLDMKKDLIKNNQAIQSVLDKLGNLADMLHKKDNNIDYKFASIIKYNNFSALEYLFMKVVDDLEKKEKNIQHQEDEQCCICQCELYDGVYKMTENDFIKQIQNNSDEDAIQLLDCDGHFFHFGCIKHMLKDSHIKCPVCSKIYGVMTGDQPNGKMTTYIDKNFQCTGFNCSTIVINYQIYSSVSHGKQIPGTQRTAYLPDNEEGREVLKLLQIAFDRKLIFTVGRSVTTGTDNVVVWNGIHHKTSLKGGAAYFGYPDPTYFNRVKQELALKGVK
ncbi:hypothetical protein ABPG72_004724 [Tetrahymena utriculariae]